ncbi:hypothetical protein GCM10009848_35060 [Micromonospora lupini]
MGGRGSQGPDRSADRLRQPQPLSVDVTGGQRLELRLTDGGDGVGNDHGDWGAARLTCDA